MAKNDIEIQQIEKAFKSNDIAIFFATNDNYCPQTAVMIESIIELSSAEHNYDIVILIDSVSDDSIKKIQSLNKNRENISIRFISISKLIENVNFYVGAHYTTSTSYSKEAYFRLFIPLVAKKYKKVVYCDCDMVTIKDLYELNDIDLGNFSIAATRDYCGNAACYDPGSERLKYRKEIGIDDIDEYFISSLLIFNIKKINYSYDYIKKIISTREWKQHDQDILNLIFKGKVKLINAKWSFLEILDYPNKYSDKKSVFNELLDASRQPYIIHYAAEKKPWEDNVSYLTDYFWEYCSRTPYLMYFIKKIKGNIGYKYNILNTLLAIPVNLVTYDGKILLSANDTLFGTSDDISITIEFIEVHGDNVYIAGNFEGLVERIRLDVTFDSKPINVDYKTYKNSGIKFRRSITSFSFSFKLNQKNKRSKLSFYFLHNKERAVPKKITFGDFAPLNDVKCSYFRFNKRILYCKQNILHFDKSVFFIKTIYHTKMFFYLLNKKSKYFIHILLFRILYMLSRIFLVRKLVKSKCFINYTENSDCNLAIELYNAILKFNSALKPYLIVQKREDFCNLKNRYNVLLRETKKHKLNFLFCRKLISDIYDYRFYLPLFVRANEIRDIICDKDMYFIDTNRLAYQYFTKSFHNFKCIFFNNQKRYKYFIENNYNNGYTKKNAFYYNNGKMEEVAKMIIGG